MTSGPVAARRGGIDAVGDIVGRGDERRPAGPTATAIGRSASVGAGLDRDADAVDAA